MTKETGNYGEQLAVKFLKKSGYKIIGQNVTNKIGEIDILARRKKIIVVVEVKTKSTKQFGEGFEMVNYFKRRKLLVLAKSLHIKYPKSVTRIDIISIDLSGQIPRLKHFENAVEDN